MYSVCQRSVATSNLGFPVSRHKPKKMKAQYEKFVFMQDLSNRFFFTFVADVASIKEFLAT